MKLNRVATTGVVVLGIGAACIAGVSVANAAPVPERASTAISSGVSSAVTDPGRGSDGSASASVGPDGNHVVTGDVDPTVVELPPFSAETEAALEAESAKHPGGAMISIDKDGKVTSTPLTGATGGITAVAPSK